MRLIDADKMKPREICPSPSNPYEDDDTAYETLVDWIDEQPTAMEWISIKDRLPKTHKVRGEDFIESPVVFLFDGKYVYHGWLSKRTNDKKFTAFGHNLNWDVVPIRKNIKVTHWMPIPEPPKEETNVSD